MSAPDSKLVQLQRQACQLQHDLSLLREQIKKEEMKQVRRDREQSSDLIIVNGKAIRMYISEQSTIETDPAIECTEYKPVKKAEASVSFDCCKTTIDLKICIGENTVIESPNCALEYYGLNESLAQLAGWRIVFKRGERTLTLLHATFEQEEESGDGDDDVEEMGESDQEEEEEEEDDSAK